MKKLLSKLKRSASPRLDRTSDPAAPSATITQANSPSQNEGLTPARIYSIPTANPDSNDPQRNAPLENFPPEIRRHLLSMTELEGLKALVHASPVYLQQYLRDRRYILCKSFETTLRSVTVDACFVYQSGFAEFSKTRTSATVTHFLKDYKDRRSSIHCSVPDETFTLDEVVSMVAFHFSIIIPLARHYTVCALDNLAKETKTPQNQELALSKTEEIRLLRALYRFQLFCNLFGKGPDIPFGRRTSRSFGFEGEDILTTFFCIFEPWEVEEISCIHTFAMDKYNQIFDDIAWDVDEKNPKFDGQRPPTPDGAFHFGNSWTRHSLLEGTISLGFELLHTVFFKIKNHADMVTVMQEEITYMFCSFLDALDETSQHIRRDRHVSDRDLMQERRDPLPFRGDFETSDSNQEGLLYPPLAWTLMWRGTYSNLYGWYIEDEFRRWGYIMWDAVRMEGTGAKEVLMRQWGDFDPRDDIYV